MESLELNRECNEITATGSLGYILLYLDNRPSMRWRFKKSMKIKLVWEKRERTSDIKKIKTKFSSQYKRPEPSNKLSSLLTSHQEWGKQHNDATSSSQIVHAISSTSSTSVHSDSTAALTRPSALPQSNNQTTVTSSTFSSGAEEDFDITFDKESIDFNVCGTDIELSKPICKYCGSLTLSSEKEEHDHQRNPSCFSKCVNCQGDFFNQGDLLLHQFKSYGSDFVTLHYPKFDFIKNNDLEQSKHFESNKCPICHEAFSTVSFLKDHISTVHFQEGIFKCCVCAEIQPSQILLKEHLRKNHDSELKTEQGESSQSYMRDSEDLYRQTQMQKYSELNENVNNINAVSLSQKKETHTLLLGEESKKVLELNKEKIKRKDENEKKVNCSFFKMITEKAKTKGTRFDQCKLCKKQFFNITEHFEAPKKRVKCSSCHHICASQAHLIAHQHIYHSDKTKEVKRAEDCIEATPFSKSYVTDQNKRKKRCYSCPLCEIKIQRGNLVNHIKNQHTRESIFSCCFCKKEISHRAWLIEHVKNHLGVETKRGKWHCSLCPAVLSSSGEFHRHARAHKTVCAFCHKDFSFQKLLQQHYHQEHEDRLIPCKICGKRLPTKQQHWTHERYHKYKKAETCHICGKSFISIHKHLSLVHNYNSKESDKDKADSSTPSSLNNGGSESVNPRKFLCSMCPETFPSEGFLVRHMTTIHKQSMGLKCPQCPKRFHSKAQLMSHINRHVNRKEKKFTCNVCGKIFSENYTMKMHMRIHAPEKYFHCSTCGDGFNYKVSLVTHMRTKHGISK